MDDPGIGEGEHIAALDGIAQANRLTGLASKFWRSLACLQKQLDTPIRVLDVACGKGDIVATLARRAAAQNVPITFAGCDISARCLDYARQHAIDSAVDVEFFALDVLAEEIPEGYHAIINSQFMHHLDPPEIIAVLQNMARSTKETIHVIDLTRSYLNWLLIWAGTRLLSGSKVMHFDGPVSVQAAFTVDEWRELALQAGLENALITPAGQLHMQLLWQKTKGRSS
jgi:2-polyprenyl-3-methyl-5-hydroxy-6-metoxy-1,4-benzoquinol methylase